MLLADVVAASTEVGATRSRTAKVAALARTLAAADADETGVVVGHLSGVLPQRRLGVGWRSLSRMPDPAAEPTLTVADVDRSFTGIAATTGPGSVAARRALLDDLLSRATEPEQAFVRDLVVGNLRQGALDGVMQPAIAQAFGVPDAAVRRAIMLSGFAAPVAEAARSGGVEALDAIDLEVGRPVRPMLASSAKTVAEAIGAGCPVIVDGKLDGIRIQAHRRDGEVTLFTRSLDDITSRLPEVVEAIAALPGGDLVVDGEAIVLGPGGRPEPFQVTGARTASSADPDALRVTAPVTTFLFDVLHRDGRTSWTPPRATDTLCCSTSLHTCWCRASSTRIPLRHNSSSTTWSQPDTKGSSSSASVRRTPPAAAAASGSRSSQCTPSTSSSSPSSGAAVAAAARCPTSTSARVTRSPAASSCSARPSRG